MDRPSTRNPTCHLPTNRQTLAFRRQEMQRRIRTTCWVAEGWQYHKETWLEGGLVFEKRWEWSRGVLLGVIGFDKQKIMWTTRKQIWKMIWVTWSSHFAFVFVGERSDFPNHSIRRRVWYYSSFVNGVFGVRWTVRGSTGCAKEFNFNALRIITCIENVISAERLSTRQLIPFPPLSPVICLASTICFR